MFRGTLDEPPPVSASRSSLIWHRSLLVVDFIEETVAPSAPSTKSGNFQTRLNWRKM
jgi:hypothetical protein